MWLSSTTALMSQSLCQTSLLFCRFHDLQRRDHLPCFIAPGITLIGNDSGQVDFTELVPERLHGRAGYAVEYHIDMLGHVAGGNGTAAKRRKRRWQAVTVRHMAGCATGAVDLLAPGHELFKRPLIASQLIFLTGFLLAFRHPDLILFLGYRLDHHRHKGVILAA